MTKIFISVSILSQLIELGQDGRSKHVLDVYSACSFGVQEEEELPDGSEDVLILEVIVHIFEVNEGRDKFWNVLVEVGFGEVAVPSSVIQTDVNSGLEQVVLPDYRMEERLHIDSPVLIPIELQKCWSTEEMSKLEG